MFVCFKEILRLFIMACRKHKNMSPHLHVLGGQFNRESYPVRSAHVMRGACEVSVPCYVYISSLSSLKERCNRGLSKTLRPSYFCQIYLGATEKSSEMRSFRLSLHTPERTGPDFSKENIIRYQPGRLLLASYAERNSRGRTKDNQDPAEQRNILGILIK